MDPLSQNTTQQDKIKVVLVDDSAVIRGALSRILRNDPNIEIVGSVSNGEIGIAQARVKQPDILILDVEMPVMDGITALPKILQASPKTKVIMCSTLTEKGADITIKALALGAVDAIAKPTSSTETGPGSPFQRDLLALIENLVPRLARNSVSPRRERVLHLQQPPRRERQSRQHPRLHPFPCTKIRPPTRENRTSSPSAVPPAGRRLFSKFSRISPALTCLSSLHNICRRPSQGFLPITSASKQVFLLMKEKTTCLWNVDISTLRRGENTCSSRKRPVLLKSNWTTDRKKIFANRP